MKYTYLKYLFIISFVTVGPCIYAAYTPQPHPLNAYVTFETNDWNNAVTKTLADAIRQRVTCIVSTAVMYKLCTEKALKMLSACVFLEDQKQWSIFVNDDVMFCVLIPEVYSDKLLAERSFVGLRHVANDQLKSFFSNKLFDKISIEVTKFKNLFSSQNVPKRFVLQGHGGTGKLIAGLPINSFLELLHELSLINTEFIYVETCFAAGTNLVAMQQGQVKIADRLFTITKTQFPLVVQATTDEITFSGVNDFRRFFNNLDKLLFEMTRNYYIGRAPSGITIAQVIKPLIGDYPTALRLPSVRFPGTNSFFRAIVLDRVAIVTNLMVRQLSTKAAFEQRYITGLKSPAEPLITISNQADYVLVFPSDCSAIKFTIQDRSKFPRFISKIPGTAQHYIGTIKLDSCELDDFVSQTFLSSLGHYEQKEKLYNVFGVQQKAWFIEHVLYNVIKLSDAFEEIYMPSALSGLIIYKPKTIEISGLPAGSEQPPVVATLLYKNIDTQTYYIAHEKLPLALGAYISFVPITATWYALWARFIHQNTRAIAGALYEASGGIENSNSEEIAFAHFKQSIGIPFERLRIGKEDIRQAINDLSQEDLDLHGAALILFQDLIKIKRFDITNNIVHKLAEADQLQSIPQLLTLLIDSDEYDQGFELITFFIKNKKLSPDLADAINEKVGKSKAGVEFISRFIKKNFKAGGVLVQQYLLRMLIYLVKENQQQFYVPSVIKARELAISFDEGVQTLAFRLFDALVEKNIEINTALEAALNYLVSKNLPVSSIARSIIKKIIARSDVTMKDKIINLIHAAPSWGVVEIVQQINQDKNFIPSQLHRLFEIIIHRIKSSEDFDTLDDLGNALLTLALNKSLMLSEQDSIAILNALIIIINSCPDVALSGLFSLPLTKRQYRELIISTASELPIPSLAERLKRQLKTQ